MISPWTMYSLALTTMDLNASGVMLERKGGASGRAAAAGFAGRGALRRSVIASILASALS